MGSVAVRCVRRAIEERVGLGGCVRLDRDHPRGLVAIFVHELGLVRERLVDLRDRARDRRVEIAERLHGFDRAEGLARVEVRANLHVERDERDVTELVDGEARDADHELVALGAGPFMVLGEAAIGGKIVRAHGGLRQTLVEEGRFLVMNGVFTTTASMCLPRQLTRNFVPTAASSVGK